MQRSIPKAPFLEFGYTCDVKCFKCNRRKGKRPCPALNSRICPQCCGEKRVVEIACPPDCTFLKSGQTYHWTKRYVAILESEENPRRKQLLYETSQTFHPLLIEMERVVVEYATDLTSLSDGDILEASDLLKEAYRTESKGVIYEPASANPLSQALFRKWREFLDERTKELASKGYRLTASDLLKCIEVLQTEIRFHLQDSSSGLDYLSFAARNHPDLAAEKGKGGIIITGR